MIRRLIKLLAVIGILMLVLAFSFPKPNVLMEVPDPCYMENTTFVDGEELVYKVYYNWNFVWIPAGFATFTVTDVGDQWHLVVVGRTMKSYEWFYKVNDRYETYIDKQTMLPVKYIRSLAEGSYRLYSRIEFDQENQKLTNWWGDYESDAKPTEYNVEPCMHDLLSIVYYMRNIDREYTTADTKVPVKIFLDKEIWNLNVRFYGSETKRIKGSGKFNAIRFSPELIVNEMFQEGDQMMIWSTDDGNRLPLLIESPVSVGSVQAFLHTYEGLRNDFEAKVE